MPTPIPNEILQNKFKPQGGSNDYFAVNPATGQPERIYTHPKAATPAPGLTQEILDGGYASISEYLRQTEAAAVQQFDYFFESDIPAGAPKTYHGEDSKFKGYTPYNDPTAGSNATENVGNLAWTATLSALLGGTGFGSNLGVGAGVETGASESFGLTGMEGGGGAAADTAWGVNPQFTGAETGAGESFGLTGAETGVVPAGSEISLQQALGGTGAVGAGGGAASGGSSSTTNSTYGDSPEYSTGAGETGASEDYGLTGNEGGTTADTDWWAKIKELYGNKDLMKTIGSVVGTGLGVAGATNRQNSLEALANRYWDVGDPYRRKLGDLYSNPSSFLSSPEVTIPVQQGTDATARALSVQGNPFGNPRAMQEIQNYSANQLFGRLGQEKDRLAGFGGLTAYNQAAPGALTGSALAKGGVYDALGSGVADITNPQPSLQEILRQIMKNNQNQTSGTVSL